MSTNLENYIYFVKTYLKIRLMLKTEVFIECCHLLSTLLLFTFSILISYKMTYFETKCDILIIDQ
jgi:hypothetical protein